MSRVSYQVAFDRTDAMPPAFEALDADAIDTRKRDAKVRFAVDLSKRQARWLKNAGTGDADAVIRALVDLGMQLNIDWHAVKTSGDLRAAVREAVLIRHRS
jgi:hypothetical protein